MLSKLTELQALPQSLSHTMTECLMFSAKVLEIR